MIRGKRRWPFGSLAIVLLGPRPALAGRPMEKWWSGTVAIPLPDGKPHVG